MSPLLFNLVADALNQSLQKLQSAGILSGLGNFGPLGPVLNLQFADDTLLFLKAEPKIIEALKLHLIAFENLSGMKINYAKSEMVPLNLNPAEGEVLASIFGCKTAKLPLTYLGLPLHFKKPSIKDWQVVIDKITSRIQGWKGKLLSYGGRLILLNSVISSIPIYWLSVFKMPSKVRDRIDQLRKRFLWYGGHAVKKKYYLVSWETVCKSKSQGGLGIIDLKRLNQALLAKWWIRFQDPSISGLWKTILLAKYGQSGYSSTCSSFWAGILKGTAVVELGLTRHLGNGSTIKFWTDRWCSEHPLSLLYPNLFQHSSDPDLLVVEAFENSSLQLHFTRQLTGILLTEWHSLHTQLINCTPNPSISDTLSWRWSNIGAFSVHSFYL